VTCCPRAMDLRHYTATKLFRSGHPGRTNADRLGHSDPATTLQVYTHGTEDQAAAAALPWRPESPAERDISGYPDRVLIAWIAAHIAVTVMSMLVLPFAVLMVMGRGQSKPQPVRAVSDSPD
jgi:hypothetical protein